MCISSPLCRSTIRCVGRGGEIFACSHDLRWYSLTHTHTCSNTNLWISPCTYANPYHQIFYPVRVCSLNFVWSTLKHDNGSLCDPSGGYRANWPGHTPTSKYSEWVWVECDCLQWLSLHLGLAGYISLSTLASCIHTYSVMCGHVLKSIHTHTYMLSWALQCVHYTLIWSQYIIITFHSLILQHVFLDSHCISTDVHWVTECGWVTDDLSTMSIVSMLYVRMCSCTDVCACCVYMLCVYCCTWVFGCECTCGYHTATSCKCFDYCGMYLAQLAIHHVGHGNSTPQSGMIGMTLPCYHAGPLKVIHWLQVTLT